MPEAFFLGLIKKVVLTFVGFFVCYFAGHVLGARLASTAHGRDAISKLATLALFMLFVFTVLLR
jgi:hypothetical protein